MASDFRSGVGFSSNEFVQFRRFNSLIFDLSSRSLSTGGTQMNIDSVFEARQGITSIFATRLPTRGRPPRRRCAATLSLFELRGQLDSPHAFMLAKGCALPNNARTSEEPKTAQIVPHGPRTAIVQLVFYQSFLLSIQPAGSIGRRP